MKAIETSKYRSPPDKYRRYRARGYFRWISGILALVMGLMLTGAIYESVAETADAQAFPPPGQMVAVGSYRLHLNCTGSGSPTVVIDTGWGDCVCRMGLGAARSRENHPCLHI